jgi:hypothetical protein
MGRAEQYREHAAECLALAKTVADRKWRRHLIGIAAQWLELADLETEKAPPPEHKPTQVPLSEPRPQ